MGSSEFYSTEGSLRVNIRQERLGINFGSQGNSCLNRFPILRPTAIYREKKTLGRQANNCIPCATVLEDGLNIGIIPGAFR